MQRFYKIFTLAIFLLAANDIWAMEDVKEPKKMQWQFDGIFGTFDRQAIQRGFKVYKEVCSACHGVNRIAFRNLTEIGFSEAEVKSLAGQYLITDGPNDEGEMFERPGRASDHIPSPFKNEQASRAANNGAYPPDLSLIIKAREDGANYVYSLLTGFYDPPAGFELQEGMYYNPYFAAGGSQLAMAPPLTMEGQVEFNDGTKATIEQMAWDVVNFLQWAAEPEMEERKSIGIKVIIFVSIMTLLFYMAMRRIWSRVK